MAENKHIPENLRPMQEWSLERKKQVMKKFEKKFVEDEISGCWNWTAYKDRYGYGRFGVNRNPQLAHRVAFMLYIGEITDSLCICHHCDNPGCVNPSHLFLGTIQDNMDDRNKKGRTRGGLNAKSTKDDVRCKGAA